MKRVFSIGERVWYEDDHESGWGKLILVNNENKWKQYICHDDCGDILTIEKDEESGNGIIETTPSRVYQLAPGRYFQGEEVVWEHDVDLDEYPFYCPARQENCYHFEVETEFYED